MKFLDEDMIDANFFAEDAEDAIRRAGNLLLNSGGVDKKYIDAMVNSFKENGSYFVLAPKIALPHARPEDGVNEASVSLVRLRQPIKFGHHTNDPVHLVFGLGATSGDEHLKILQKLTYLLGSKETAAELIDASGTGEILSIIEKRNGL